MMLILSIKDDFLNYLKAYFWPLAGQPSAAIDIQNAAQACAGNVSREGCQLEKDHKGNVSTEMISARQPAEPHVSELNLDEGPSCRLEAPPGMQSLQSLNAAPASGHQEAEGFGLRRSQASSCQT